LKINNLLTKLEYWKIILLAVLLNLVNSLVFSFISNFFLKTKLNKGFIPFNSLLNEIVLVIIIAPIIETLAFQYGIIETLKNKYKPLTCCIISGFIFGLSHIYNVIYFLFGLISGLIFAYLYFIGGSIKKGIILVFSTHLIYNSLALILNHLDI
jgi:membrane protease YdiL (CAAX protease family)